MEQTNKPKKGLSIAKKIIIGAIAVIVVVALLPKDNTSAKAASDNSTQQAIVNDADESPSMTVSASSLVKAYEDNEVSADNKYKDKTVQVTGYVASIAKDITDDSYVTLAPTDDEDDFSLTSVQCYFKSGNNLANLKKGQKLTLVGKVDGKMGNILMKGCNIK